METHHTSRPGSPSAAAIPDTTTPAAAPEVSLVAPTLMPTGALTPHALSARLPAITDQERTSLRADITTHGMITPIEATSDRTILDGHARWQIATELGLDGVPVRIVDPDDQAAFIFARAVGRRNLSASQRAALAVECAQYEREIAAGRARRMANLAPSADVAALPHRDGRTRDRAAKLAGVSPRTIQDAATVREADPELFAQVLDGRIPADKAARQIRRAQRHAEIAPAPPMPDGPFDLILADPPWQMGAPDAPTAPENHYPTMTLAEIAALEIPVADDAILFLWAVNSLLPEALEVMRAWGFAYRANVCWVKPSIGNGQWARQRHELLLVGIRGTMATPRYEDRPDSVIEAPRGRHSAKPEETYARIERAYPHASKCELFARGTPRAGWIAWGNEVITR